MSTGDVDPSSSVTSAIPCLETPAHASSTITSTSAVNAPVAVATIPIMALAPIPHVTATSAEPFDPSRTIDPFIAAAAISAVACADVPTLAMTTSPTLNIVSADPGTVSADPEPVSAPGIGTAEAVLGSQGNAPYSGVMWYSRFNKLYSDSSTSIETLASNGGKELGRTGPPLKKRKTCEISVLSLF